MTQKRFPVWRRELGEDESRRQFEKDAEDFFKDSQCSDCEIKEYTEGYWKVRDAQEDGRIVRIKMKEIDECLVKILEYIDENLRFYSQKYEAIYDNEDIHHLIAPKHQKGNGLKLCFIIFGIIVVMVLAMLPISWMMDLF